jgi:hypothetical protein
LKLLAGFAIAGGTTLAFGVISFIVYSKWEHETIALAILIAGFITGAIWATRISIKYGTMEWLSQIRRIS